MRSKPIAERLWPRGERHPEFGCLMWTGTCYPNGYGVISLGGRGGKLTGVHRVAYALTYGAETIVGRMICHTCDALRPPGDTSYRRCFEPTHLFAGTNSDNMRDMHAKGRYQSNAPRGANHPKAKLSHEDVARVKSLRSEGVTYKALAAMFGVSRWAINNILSGRSWKHDQ